LSNFIKYNFAQEVPATKARIINSNRKMEEMMKTWQAAPVVEEQMEDEEVFSEGLMAEVVEIEPQITPEELLEQAEAEARQMIDDANAVAAQIEAEANEKAQQLFEEQRAAGAEAGRAEAENYLNEQQALLQQQLDELSQGLEAEYQEKHQLMEAEIVDAISAVIEKNFGLFMTDHKDVLMYLIKRTMYGIESSKNFKIRVSIEDAKMLMEQLEELRNEFGSDVSIDVQRDETMNEGDCILETEYGVYHCGIDLQLQNLIMQMRALSS